ncbi:MarR family transcriptional regulator [Amycolatopsis sp. H20-H5]|uniref:MarR family transcriptional regulator n=1 Tax=Amycolatopsis sp. H20-H5 TaxID=3046309 RepID=UPI002DB60EEA|nr:MarR family transcriptional regulator [Amycolatopsis sp. H20-H5]MEC3980111.1 MarR family transcriptional regulator [Amycolatopsis sp. H20-H5]
MDSVPVGEPGDGRLRARSAAAVKEGLRELRISFSLLNRQVGAHLQVKDIDLDCLELISRHGPLSPSGLARLADLHPATVTGILDRLQQGGWVVRERHPEATDRRAITVRAVSDRNAELFRIYSGMNSAMDRICDGYTREELNLIAAFLRLTADAGQHATDELAGD